MGSALLGPVDEALVAALDAVGLPPVGALADAFAPVQGERFGGALQVLAAAEAGRLRAAAVAPSAAPLLPDLLAAGLPAVLSAAAPWDPDLLRECRGLAAERDVPVGVLLRTRCAPWAVAADTAVAGAAAAPVQVTVRGWDRSPVAAAELVDLLLRWTGPVAAACAAPGALPAAALPAGERVAWALLSERGATVLVSYEGQPGLRVSLPDRRLHAGPAGTWWDGGDPLPLPEELPWTGDATGRARGPRTAAQQLARAFETSVRLGLSDPLGSALTPWPWPPELADLLPVAGVLEALARSAAQDGWVELG